MPLMARTNSLWIRPASVWQPALDFRVENDLNKSFPVPEIDKDHPAMIPPPVGPAHQYHFLTGMGGVQITAVMGPFPNSQKIRQSFLPRYLHDGFFQVVKSDLFLGAGTHVPQEGPILIDLPFADDQGKRALQFVRPLHLTLEASAGIIHLRPDPLHPQTVAQEEGLFDGPFTEGGDEEERTFLIVLSPIRDERRQAFQTDGKPDPGNIRTAEVPNKMIVPPAAQDGILRTEEFGGYLECGPRVVIEAADHFGIESEWNLKEVQARLELCEMFPAGRAEEFRQTRGVVR